MEDFMAADIRFYKQKTNRLPTNQASLEAKLLLPLECLAYGIPFHVMAPYFQMSTTMAADCCNHFDTAIKKLYLDEYLRLPTPNDLRAIINLHKDVHGVAGMIGSIDCTHTYWKNCPTAWQGSFKNGRNKLPSIVLEAVSDHNMFFWHVAYGFAGCLGDVTIIHQSPLFDRMLDGQMEKVEEESGVIPYQTLEETFDKTFLLSDGHRNLQQHPWDQSLHQACTKPLHRPSSPYHSQAYCEG
jgi:Plant transposon protein